MRFYLIPSLFVVAVITTSCFSSGKSKSMATASNPTQASDFQAIDAAVEQAGYGSHSQFLSATAQLATEVNSAGDDASRWMAIGKLEVLLKNADSADDFSGLKDALEPFCVKQNWTASQCSMEMTNYGRARAEWAKNYLAKIQSMKDEQDKKAKALGY